MLCTEIVSDIQNNFCTQHVLPMFCKKKSFWQRFTCTAYTCSICNFGFTHKKSLENHMINTHSQGEKPYSCEICNKKFMLNHKMKEHFNSIHDGKNQPFPCPKCVVGFTKNSDLQRHISSVHEGKEFVNMNDLRSIHNYFFYSKILDGTYLSIFKRERF